MIKYIILVIILNSVLFISIFNNQEVYLQIKAPTVAEAGSTVEIEIELHKGQLTGFARFQQELPYGVTASPVYPADMNFSFEDNTVTMIWLSLPREEDITIRYRLHIHERLKGDLQLNGTFSYIENNQRLLAGASGMTMAINPSPVIEERLIVDISEAAARLPAPAAVSTRDIVAIRQEPVPDNDLGFIVTILVNKEDKEHFAKIEDKIPDGFRAIELDSQGGIFSFSGQRARIIWRNLPPARTFFVSYRLIPDEQTDEIPELTGEFSFVHNDVTINRKIAQDDADLRELSENEREQLIASVSRETEISDQTPVPVAAARTPPAPPTVATRPDFRPEMKLSNPLEAEQGVYYRVQLAAGHRPVDVRSYFRRLNITDEVHTEIHEGWIKYSIGSFSDYRSARDRRVNIWNTTPVGDAFVSAYNEGQRITVQEALVIGDHQWVR